MSVKIKFVKNVIFVYTAKIAFIILNLIYFVIIVRFLSVREFGILAFLNAILSLVSVLYLDPLFTTSFERFIPEYHVYDNKKNIANLLIASILIRLIKGSALAIVLFFCFKPIVYNFFNLEIPKDVEFIFYIIVLISSLDNINNSIIRSFQYFDFLLIVRSLKPAIQVLGVIIFVVWLKKAVYGVLLSILISSSFTTAVTYLRLKKWLRFELLGWKNVKSQVRKMISFAGGVTVSSLIALLTQKVDRFAIQKYIGDCALGIYELAVSVVFRISDVLETVGSVLNPFTAELYAKKDVYSMYEILYAVYRFVMYISIFCYATIIQWGDIIITFLFSQKYINSYYLLPFLGVAIIIRSLTATYFSLFRAFKKLNPYAIFITAANIISVFIVILLTKNYGIKGSAAAVTLYYLLISIIGHYLSYRWFNFLISPRFYIISSFLFIFLIAVNYVIKFTLQSNIQSLILGITLDVAILAAVIKMFDYSLYLHIKTISVSIFNKIVTELSKRS